jgi:hypothetical protein
VTHVLAAIVAHSGTAASAAELAPAMTLIGLGMGATFSTIYDVAIGDIDRTEAGSASGSLSSIQQLANAIGAAVITTIYFRALAGGPAWAMTLSLLTVIAIGVLSCLAIPLLPRHAQPARTDQLAPPPGCHACPTFRRSPAEENGTEQATLGASRNQHYASTPRTVTRLGARLSRPLRPVGGPRTAEHAVSQPACLCIASAEHERPDLPLLTSPRVPICGLGITVYVSAAEMTWRRQRFSRSALAWETGPRRQGCPRARASMYVDGLSGEADGQDEVPEPQVQFSATGPVHDECQQDDGQNGDHHPEEEHDDAGDGIPRYCSRSSHDRQLPAAAHVIRSRNPTTVRRFPEPLGRACRGRYARRCRTGSAAISALSSGPRVERCGFSQPVSARTSSQQPRGGESRARPCRPEFPLVPLTGIERRGCEISRRRALSRLEAGGVIPTIPLLDRISAAPDADLIVEIAPHPA